jgi:hypothetical protein
VVTKLDRLGRSLEHLFELSKQPQTRSGRCRVFAANTRKRPDGAGQHRTYEERPRDLLSQVAGAFRVVWRVRDSNPRRRSRLIYRQPRSHGKYPRDLHRFTDTAVGTGAVTH